MSHSRCCTNCSNSARKLRPTYISRTLAHYPPLNRAFRRLPVPERFPPKTKWYRNCLQEVRKSLKAFWIAA
ncbi:hypothetical protein Y032_0442g1527 [Ancylostoma ceylanicum]|uniref:Uncharacterized protein n=1 Tax=Ancylostoma ceylanicum TaxID=53326 RepID=A0A016WZB3_9BILA|nr:hypothetical protein Y032_0442g1527 [Ancylostoma ceylanicum]